MERVRAERLELVSVFSEANHPPFARSNSMRLVKAGHHGDEFLELDLSVPIFVDLLDNCVDLLLAEGVGAAEAEHLTDLVGRDDARTVLVEHLEGGAQLLLRGQLRLARSGNHELRVVDEARVVSVDGLEHLFDFLVGHDPPVVVKISGLHLLHRQLAVSVFVEGLEHLGEVVALLLAHQLRGDEGVGGHLEGNIAVELLQVVKGVHGHGLVNLQSGQSSEPWVLQGVSSAGTLLRIVDEEGLDEGFGVVGDGGPNTIFKRENTLANLLHNVLVALAVEGRHT